MACQSQVATSLLCALLAAMHMPQDLGQQLVVTSSVRDGDITAPSYVMRGFGLIRTWLQQCDDQQRLAGKFSC